MSFFKDRGLFAVGIVALAQTLVLATMIHDRTSLLRNGQEVILEAEPVDPRSLFRGDYVILNYPVSTTTVSAEEKARIVAAQRAYVRLGKGADGNWEARGTTAMWPETVGAGEVVLAGRPDVTWWGGFGVTEVRLRYGIESYFVAEGRGLELEQLVRDKKLDVMLAVDDRGKAAIKALVLDGKVVHEEPLY